jgi:hypothetical protein
MIKTIVVVLTLGVALAPSSASTQQLQPQQRIDAALGRSAAAGIPVELLENKLAEGRAKGVPLERIALAMERRESSLLLARDAMRGVPDLRAADLGVGADALEQGVGAGVLQSLAEGAPREKRAVAIAALTELVAGGQPAEQALQRVQAALRQGPEALSNLPAQAAEARERRGPPPDPGKGRPAGAGPPGGSKGGPPAGVPAGGQGKGQGKGQGQGQGKGQGQGQGKGGGGGNKN